jgi:hypothetical protein
MTKLSMISMLLLVALTTGCYAQETGTLTQDELVRLAQQRMDAIAAGNPKPFEEQFADDALIFDERGRSMDKAALLKDTTPLPSGYSGVIKVVNPNIRTAGDAIVFSFDQDEIEIIFGQVDTARYHETDTWVKRHGGWQIIAIQVLRYYEDPPSGQADVSKYPKYLGTYQLGPTGRLTISQEGSNLYSQQVGKKKQTLIPEATDIFFIHGVEGRELFKFDEKGNVVAFIERRNNEDIVWKKLK